MTTTVIQLGSPQDVLRTLPVLRALQEQHPGELLRFLCLEENSVWVSQLTKQVTLLPVKSGFGLDELLVHRVAEDHVINLTLTDQAAALAAALSSDVRGAYLHNGELELTDAWTQFVFSGSLRSQINRFHRTDLYRGIAGVLSDNVPAPLSPPEAWLKEAQKHLTEMRLPFQDRPLVWVTPGSHYASAELLGTWQAIVDGLHKVFPSMLFGWVASTAHRAAAEQCIRGRTHCFVLPERTKAELLIGLGRLGALTIGAPDSELLYFAEGGSPCVVFSQGNEPYWETAPYGENHWILRAIKAPIDVGVAVKTLAACLSSQLETLKNVLQSDTKHRIYASRFAGHHLHQLQQICGQAEASVEGWFVDTYNIVRFEELTGQPVLPSKIMPSQEPKTLAILERLMEGIERMYRVAEFGVRYGDLIQAELKKDPTNAEEIRTLATRLRDVDATLKSVAAQVPYLVPLLDEFEVEQMSLVAGDPRATIDLGLRSYAVLMSRCALLHQKIKGVHERIKKQVLTAGGSEPPTSKPPVGGVECLTFNVREVDL